MEEKYKDWNIKYNEHAVDITKTFVATHEYKKFTSQNLSELKKKIDRYKKQEFKRIPCYLDNYRHYRKGEITSIAESDTSGNIAQVWISYEDADGIKTRTKQSVDSGYNKLYKRNDESDKLMKECRKIEGQINELNKELQNKHNLLEKITNEEIKNSAKEVKTDEK